MHVLAATALAAAAAVLSPCLAHAQAPPATPLEVVSTIATNPVGIPFGVLSGEYERAVGTRGLALGVGGVTTFGNDAWTIDDGGNERFRSLQLKLKYYPAERGLRGFAVGLTAGVAHERETLWRTFAVDPTTGAPISARATRSRTAPTVGATIDYNFLLGRRQRFLIGLGLGARRPIGVRNESGPLDEPFIDPRLQIGFGF